MHVILTKLIMHINTILENALKKSFFKNIFSVE